MATHLLVESLTHAHLVALDALTPAAARDAQDTRALAAQDRRLRECPSNQQSPTIATAQCDGS